MKQHTASFNLSLSARTDQLASLGARESIECHIEGNKASGRDVRGIMYRNILAVSVLI